MDKNVTIVLEINSSLKEKSEVLLNKMNLTMDKAVSMFLTQMLYEQRIPFNPCHPYEVNGDLMIGDELRKDIMDSYNHATNGDIIDAKDVHYK